MQGGATRIVQFKQDPTAQWGKSHGTWQWNETDAALEVWFHYTGRADKAYHHEFYLATNPDKPLDENPERNVAVLKGSWLEYNSYGRHYAGLSVPQVFVLPALAEDYQRMET